MKQVSCLIPSYNGLGLLKKYLPAVLETLANNDEVIVIDDNSSDETVKYLLEKYKLKLTKRDFNNLALKNYFPKLKSSDYKFYSNTLKVEDKSITFSLLALQKNLRFALAVNAGVLFAQYSYLLLLNNDVKVTKGLRDKLLTHFSDSSVFGVGCLEYEHNLQGDKAGKNKLWFSKGLFIHSKADEMTSGATAWVSGGSGMFDKKKWLELRGFDKLFYPAYWEDVDLSFRARKKGWKVLFDEQAVVYHCHESTNSDVFGQTKIKQMSWQNGLKFTKKNANFYQKILYYLYKPYWYYQRSKLRATK